MWKLKLKVCLINFLAYNFCILFLYLCFHGQTPYRQDGTTTAIGYMYKQEGVNETTPQEPNPEQFQTDQTETEYE